jgi:hypothetical protein
VSSTISWKVTLWRDIQSIRTMIDSLIFFSKSPLLTYFFSILSTHSFCPGFGSHSFGNYCALMITWHSYPSIWKVLIRFSGMAIAEDAPDRRSICFDRWASQSGRGAILIKAVRIA